MPRSRAASLHVGNFIGIITPHADPSGVSGLAQRWHTRERSLRSAFQLPRASRREALLNLTLRRSAGVATSGCHLYAKCKALLFARRASRGAHGESVE